MLARLHRHLGRVHREESQSIVTVALMSLFILAILAVVVESSAVYIQRRNLQNAADAAALAGAQELNGYASGEAPAIAKAQLYADENLPNLLGVTAVVSEGYTQVQVQVQKKAATAFAGWLSFGEPVVSAKATARIASFNIIRCVVPIAVQDTTYFAATENYPADPLNDLPPLVALKQSTNNVPSNTGLVRLTTGNEANAIRGGSACNLTPDIDTKPGESYGDVNNGLVDRLKAAKSNNCYRWEDVQPPSVTGEATWRCRPESTVLEGGSMQASSVVLLPILDSDIIKPGSNDYPLAQLPNGQYVLAYFWISGDHIYDQSNDHNWRCLINSGADKCIIYGRFIVNEPVDLDVFDPTKCPPGEADCVLEFDPASTTKIVQLID